MNLGIRGAFKTSVVPLESGDMRNNFGEDFRPRRIHDIMEYEVEEELSLYDPRNEVVHILNPTAAVIWRLCDGSRKVHDISARIADVYGLPADSAEGDVQEVLSKLVQAGVLR